ncbi:MULTISPECIES: hypothetical protein [unclassified Bradyrhizobium]|uniref:hypothetical protein n=1 Tax=unclassified Bradyrhizobium TaxID=2631580 RepID=UPI002306725C|nr:MULTISPECIES: hypothetical protein [unclassified Bradyrhizobium]MDA9450760.1 hypothetical protein [Bradyrhizobium sp. CCBAU 21360]MDA9458511.1 hypothetical protein [Bradyrhizobium sp. CCBAU 21359]MDA9517779.1 hypothetical protein [Bradyrhizobium sp. CCBAU 11430]
MPQIIDFEGQQHEFPDDFTRADIQRALSSRPGRPGLNPPIRVQGPDGSIVEFPAGTSNEEMTTALQKHYGGPGQTLPPLPPGYKLDPPATVPPLPPGYKLDRPVTDPALIAQLEVVPSAAKPGMFDDLIPAQGAGRQPTLVPVDHDPWAAFPDAKPPFDPSKPYQVVDKPPFDPTKPFQVVGPQPAPAAPQPKLVPVDHDPFAAPAAPVTTPVAAPSSSVTTPQGRIYVSPADGTPKPNTTPSSIHSLAVGAQGVGKGLTDIVTGPFDLVAGAQNLVVGGVNKLFGTNIPMATPASKLVEKATGPFSIPESEMSPGEKLGYNVNRFGTQALGTGAMLAARAPSVAAATSRADTAVGRVLDHLSRPYTDAPARTLVGDTIGGMGSGVAVNAADDYVPEHAVVGDTIPKQVANIVAPLAGAVGANSIQGTAEGIAGAIKSIAARSFSSAPAPIPLNPNTRAPYSAADVDRAAAKIQGAASGSPRALAQDIRENAAALSRPPEEGATPLQSSAMPTSGLLSGDPGLIAAEQGARLKSAPDFIKRDQNVKSAAAERVEAVRDPEADLGAVMRRAAKAREERIGAAENDILQREEADRSVDRIRADQGQPFGALANSDVKANASRRLDEALVDRTYIPARAEKNRLFDTAPGRNDELPADDIFGAIDRIRTGANGLAPGTLPNDFMRRLDALRPRIDPDTGQNLGGPGTALGGDLADLRKFIGPALERAQASGNFDLADNLGRLRSAINQTLEEAPGYSEANANYQRFADRFRPERNDEMARFTRELDRGGQNADGELNRGGTPPSATAGRFLAEQEKAASLTRTLEGTPAAPDAHAALRDYLRSDFAKSALNADGTVNSIRANAWARNNADVLAQFPAVRGEFDDIVATARRGEQMSTQARADLDAARANRQATEAEIDRSAVGTLFREDPRDVAQKLLGGKYNAGAKLDEINALIKSDPQAARGWKAAVSEVLADKVQGTRQVGDTLEVHFARLAREFKDNEQILAKVYSPEEMNNLRQAHMILSYFKEAEKRATVGSDTAEKMGIPGILQLGARHIWGDLKGGGIIKRFKLMLELLPNNKESADQIVQAAWFNPDIAAYLLERPLKNQNVTFNSVPLRRLVAAANASRESGNE